MASAEQGHKYLIMYFSPISKSVRVLEPGQPGFQTCQDLLLVPGFHVNVTIGPKASPG